MKQQNKKHNVNGWIIIDKPTGKTSSKVVNEVRHLLSARKAGHAGTLDPAATGILPIALGEATKTIPYLVNSLKSYQFTVRWGEDRDTNDSEGSIIASSKIRPDITSIKHSLHEFVGQIKQLPPDYSAVKVNGQRAYKLAREKEKINLAPRTIFIESFDLIEILSDDRATFRVTSGKGAYMRSLARDLGRRLGTYGHISALRRLKVGPFSEKDAISLDSLEALAHSPENHKLILPVEAALDGIPALNLSGDKANRLRCGQSIPVSEELDWVHGEAARENGLLYTVSCGKLLAVSLLQGGCIKPVRVLNL
tara:strand:- start:1492 stop:2418 length:927 start_codon:yes stop_codon:yes gene_type:complete